MRRYCYGEMILLYNLEAIGERSYLFMSRHFRDGILHGC
jgi:hypothetical protein